MFEGEAAEKRCDISPIVIIGGSRIRLEPKELDNDFTLYYKLIYIPILIKAGLAPFKYQKESDIRTEIVLPNSSIKVRAGKLPGKCYELLSDVYKGMKDGIYCHIIVDSIEITLSAEEIARKYLPLMEMIPEELALAFKNLLHNAVKYSYRTVYTGRKRYVRIVCDYQSQKHFLISISNYGIGIEKNEIEQGLIWQPRYRGRLSRDRNRTGSGLGLSHAKKAIEKVHGGTINASSDLLAGGAYLTRFDVTLPIVQADRISI